VVGWCVVWAPCEDSVISLGSRRSRTVNIRTCASKKLEVLDALMMELHLDKEPLGAMLSRSWDPMFKEATLCVGRQSSQDGICDD
jgi:hypothetical protein